MNFVRSKAGGHADGVVSGVFKVEYMDVPVVLLFVIDHGEYLSHGVIDTFDAAFVYDGVNLCTRSLFMLSV